ncbi:hypothetical protein GCM10022631_28890 [Deinococcus rubellus]|uniref:Uncharacterized protein n=1 Tax=Deinococcus rubellus TaxID=1889240 RepID=A0ABY5YKE6_9DEIO|nr:hypothetical protein [Deinococcus rubellus]UWX65293.1 hypothetical protein N0D28_06470 [Deinococcus rubellus]
MKNLIVVLTSAALVLTACGSSTPNPGGGTGGAGTGGGTAGGGTAPSNGSTLTRAQLGTCAVLSGSSDPAATNCLKGTIVGQTVGGDGCTLVITGDGNYQYNTAKLNYTHSASSSDDSVFTSVVSSGTPYVIWSSTLVTASNIESLDFQSDTNYKIQIDAQSGGVKSTCISQL